MTRLVTVLAVGEDLSLVVTGEAARHRDDVGLLRDDVPLGNRTVTVGACHVGQEMRPMLPEDVVGNLETRTQGIGAPDAACAASFSGSSDDRRRSSGGTPCTWLSADRSSTYRRQDSRGSGAALKAERNVLLVTVRERLDRRGRRSARRDGRLLCAENQGREQQEREQDSHSARVCHHDNQVRILTRGGRLANTARSVRLRTTIVSRRTVRAPVEQDAHHNLQSTGLQAVYGSGGGSEHGRSVAF